MLNCCQLDYKTIPGTFPFWKGVYNLLVCRLSIGSYWVLRLPYVYWGEGGAHLPPLIPPPRDQPYGVLIKGG